MCRAWRDERANEFFVDPISPHNPPHRTNHYVGGILQASAVAESPLEHESFLEALPDEPLETFYWRCSVLLVDTVS